MSADHLRAFINLQLLGDAARRFLNLDLRVRGEEDPFLPLPRRLACRRFVDLPVQGRYLGTLCESCDVWIHLPYDEGSLARLGLDEVEGGEPLDRVTDGVP